MTVIRHAGTWLPGMIVFFAVVTAVDELFRDELTWERVVIYGTATVALMFGAWALIQMARLSRGGYPSFLLLTFIYQKITLTLVFGVITMIQIAEHMPEFPHPPEGTLYPILVGSIIATSCVNIVLFFGRTRGWLEMPVDPMPFRSYIRNKRRQDS